MTNISNNVPINFAVSVTIFKFFERTKRICQVKKSQCMGCENILKICDIYLVPQMYVCLKNVSTSGYGHLRDGAEGVEPSSHLRYNNPQTLLSGSPN